MRLLPIFSFSQKVPNQHTETLTQTGSESEHLFLVPRMLCCIWGPHLCSPPSSSLHFLTPPPRGFGLLCCRCEKLLPNIPAHTLGSKGKQVL